MTLKTSVKPLSLIIASILLQACGGGSGGGGSTTANYGENEYDISSVVDVNSSSNEIRDDAAIDSEVGITATASDLDVDYNTVTYTLSDDANGMFAIDASTGVVTLASSLNFADAATHTIEVTATSADTSTNFSAFTVTVLDSAAPSIALGFPTANASVNADSLTLSGRFELAGEATLTTFTAKNGAQAAIDVSANAGTWSTTAALTADSNNAITLTLTDSNGKTATQVVNIEHFSPLSGAQATMSGAQGIAFDAENNKAYISDENLPGVYVLNLSDNTSEEFSGPNVGTGSLFEDDLEGGIALDAANNRLLVTDDGRNAVIAVDLATGNRSDFSVGNNISGPFGIAIDVANERALLVDTTLDGVLALSLADGTQTIISSEKSGAEVGTGDVSLTSPRDIAINSTGTLAYVVGTGADAVVAIDLSNGNRSILSGSGTGTGTGFSSIRGITLDETGNRVLVSDAGSGFEGVISVDLTTGNRTELSGQNAGATDTSGADFDSTRAVVVDSANNRLIVVDADISAPVAVDLTSGDRSLIQPPRAESPSVGTGQALADATGMALDPSGEALYVADDSADVIIKVDLASGDRSVVLASNGTTMTQIRGIGFDTENNQLLAVDNADDVLVSIDIALGSSALISSNQEGDALTFGSPRGHIAIESATSALVCDTSRDTLYRVNLETGERSVLAKDGSTDTALLEGIQSVVIDADNNRALVTSSSSNGIYGLVAVDLTSGATTLLANLSTDEPAVGSGVDILNPRGLALDKANGRVLILDSGSNADALVAVDSNTLERTLIANAAEGNGDLLSNALNGSNSMVLDAENQRVFAVNTDDNRIVVIDLNSGDQAVVSK